MIAIGSTGKALPPLSLAVARDEEKFIDLVVHQFV